MKPEFNRPQQARSRERWDRVREAFLGKLREKGFERLTVIELAETAEVSPAWIYTRFKSKEDLGVYLIEDYLENEVYRWETFSGSKNWEWAVLAERIQGLISNWAESFESEAGLFSLWNSEKFRDRVTRRPFDQWMPQIERWILECEDEFTRPLNAEELHAKLRLARDLLFESDPLKAKSRTSLISKGLASELKG